MSQPAAVPAPAEPPRLRKVEHPDLAPFLTHLCGRARPSTLSVPQAIRELHPSRRLEDILWQARIRGFQPYSGGDPAVCLTESTVKGLEFLIGRRGYAPWGLVFDRQTVYDAGGGPVWYVRPEEFTTVGTVSQRVRSWLVRLEPGRSEWLEEREWRIPLPPVADNDQWVPLEQLRPIAILVGDADWSPTRDDWFMSPLSGELEYGRCLPGLTVGLARWWWSPASQRLQSLPPLHG